MRSSAEVARIGKISRARMSQILGLRNLAPAIQEKLLRWPKTVSGASLLTNHLKRGPDTLRRQVARNA
jgi:hypothetical protein